MKKVLVTGAAGAIGLKVIKYLLLYTNLPHEYDDAASTTIFLISTGKTFSIYSSLCFKKRSKFGIDTTLISIPLVFKLLATSNTKCTSSPVAITIPVAFYQAHKLYSLHVQLHLLS